MGRRRSDFRSYDSGAVGRGRNGPLSGMHTCCGIHLAFKGSRLARGICQTICKEHAKPCLQLTLPPRLVWILESLCSKAGISLRPIESCLNG